MDKNRIMKELNNAIDILNVRGLGDVNLYVAGSSAMILRGASYRGTMDIDLARSVGKEIREVLKKYQINDSMAIATDPNISDDLVYVEEACDLIIQKQNVNVYLVWEEFVLILKGYYSNREKDIEDVEAMVGKVNSDKLDKSLELIIKSRERHGQKEPFLNDFKKVVDKLKGK